MKKFTRVLIAVGLMLGTIVLIETNHHYFMWELTTAWLILPLAYVAYYRRLWVSGLCLVIAAVYVYLAHCHTDEECWRAAQVIVVFVFITFILWYTKKQERKYDTLNTAVVRLNAAILAIRKMRNHDVYPVLSQDFKELIEIAEDAVGNVMAQSFGWRELAEKKEKVIQDSRPVKPINKEDQNDI